jgi:hypothetical protein
MSLPLGSVAAAEASPAADRPTGTPYRCSPRQLAFLEQLQRDTFRFFWDATPSGTGLTPDRTPGSDVSSVAGIGFALTSYLVGVERGYVTRAEAAARTLATLETLWRAPQGPASDGVAGYNGLLSLSDGHDGVRSNRSELSTIDTALLMAGVLAAQAYSTGRTDGAVHPAPSDRLYRRVDWAWAYSPWHRPLLSMGGAGERIIDVEWRTTKRCLRRPRPGLADTPDRSAGVEEWTAPTTGRAPTDRPRDLRSAVRAPVLACLDRLRGIQDRYMRSKQSDYFINSVRATYANRAYCIANPGR